MVQNAGRVTCPKCGANNFDTVATCFKCSAPLGQGASGGGMRAPVTRAGAYIPSPMSAEQQSLSVNSAVNNPMSAQNYGPMNGPSLTSAYPSNAYAGAGSYAASDGDPKVARRAAVLLALTLPFFGLPIGWAFMMIEDQRKQAIGRLCVNWSLIALVVHLLLTVVFMQSMGTYLQLALKLTQAAAKNQGQGSEAPSVP